MAGFSRLAQSDWSLGMVRTIARDLIPDDGVYDVVNMLLDNEGSLYKRAGSEYKSNASFGSAGLRFLWDGYLTPGQRTLFARTTSFGVLSGDDATPVDLGGSGLSSPARATEVMGMLFIDGGVVYGGSQKAADYSTGTIALTNGSKTVTGTGTAFTANADAGMLLQRGSERYYPAASVDSNTQLTLRDNYQGVTGAGITYALTRLGTANAPYRNSSIYATVAGRLVSCEGSTVYVSNTMLAGGQGPHVFNATDRVDLPRGVNILGAESVRDTLLIFTTGGVFSLSGLLLDMTDSTGRLQWRLEHLNSDMILWSKEGIAKTEDSVVVPCTNDIYLMSAAGAPESLGYFISLFFRAYVATGYKTGGATVHRNHYFLPVLDSSNNVIDTLVCRLDRPVYFRVGVHHYIAVFPWTRLAGSGASVTAFATRVGATVRQPVLLGAGRNSPSRVLALNYFDPTAARKQDADGSNVTWSFTTKDYATGQGTQNLVRRLRLRYELIDAASDNPTIQGYFGTGTTQNPSAAMWGTATWGTGTWTDSTLSDMELLSGSAPEADVRKLYTWPMAAKTRYIRFRFQSSAPASKMTMRSLEMFVRPTGKGY